MDDPVDITVSEVSAAVEAGADPESDEALRKLYGETALISRVGKFTLIHLDEPSAEEITRRITEFDPSKFFFDECPMCRLVQDEGGHIVFDGSQDKDPLRASSYGTNAAGTPEARSPAAAFDLALLKLSEEVENFEARLPVQLPKQLLERYRIDVGDLPERIIDILWTEESPRRIERFEEELVCARATLETVCIVAPELVAAATAVTRAIEALAAVWRAL